MIKALRAVIILSCPTDALSHGCPAPQPKRDTLKASHACTLATGAVQLATPTTAAPLGGRV